ncbi:Hypothetical protein FKW44_023017 [Caligus rogercresseyi]|uniref:Uncharacterized protein n=1 Tax=Caligus rogercresseyi TaxID=217165 RepID=A0A7T8GNT4_CALRO|nr:Hypothetical protein FKW44_023017 [Caligus rogercresseyi]
MRARPWKEPGSGGHNKKRTAEFLADLSDTIEASPTKSTWRSCKCGQAMVGCYLP